MAGKGSKPRPFNVDRDTFSSNWDNIFNKDKKDLLYESDNPLERPFQPKGFWEHHCKHNGEHAIAVGESCNWCGMKEDGTVD